MPERAPTTTDIAIVGGGPVGAALALALRGSGLRVLLLDAGGAAVRDQRAIALSYGSRLFLERLGLWESIDVTPIESIHVSQRGGFGRTLLTAHEAGRDALGYVCTYAQLHQALGGALARASAVCVSRHTLVEGIAGEAGAKTLRLRTEEERSGAPAAEDDRSAPGADASAAGDAPGASVSARLVVLADGGALAGALTRQFVRDYAQSALVATVRCDRAHRHRAYERFTPQGPIALLPCGADYALVWTLPPHNATALLEASDADFLSRIQSAFGNRAGRFVSVRGRGLFPLTLRMATGVEQDGVIVLGNAAQTLHPVAGQGLNLGLRDALALSRCMGEDPRATSLAQLPARFGRARAFDRVGTVALTDLLVHAFSNDLVPVRALRGLGLTLLDSLPPVRRAFADRMMFGA